MAVDWVRFAAKFFTNHWTMKQITLLLLGVLLCWSCSSIRESVIDEKTGEKIVGYDKNCNFQIGKTKRDEISEERLGQLKKDNLTFRFADDPKEGVQKGQIVSVAASGKYATVKGLRAGDSVQKALKIYGEPKAKILDYGKDEDHRIHWVLHGLFYKDFAIFTDASFTNILGFTIGEELNLDKKYIRK